MAARSEERAKAAISKLTNAAKSYKFHIRKLELMDLDQVKKAADLQRRHSGLSDQQCRDHGWSFLAH